MTSDVYFQNKRSEVSDLRLKLQNVELQHDKMKYRFVVQKVIALMTLGIDVSSLYAEMIKASATNDLVQKKLVYLYICTHAKSNTDLAVLMISTLQKDAKDDNPMIRGLALKSLCNLRLQELMDYIKEPLINGLFDRSSYVRKIAVFGALKILHFAPNIIIELKIVEQLEEMTNDNDNEVFVNSIIALNEILADEGGILIDESLADKIITRLHSVSEWGQCFLMELMSRYKPKTEDEVYSLLNILDDRLKTPNKAVVMAATKLFLLYTKDMDDLKKDIYLRIKVPILSILSSSSSELAYTALCHISYLFRGRRHLLAKDYKYFFLRGSEPLYLKSLKLSSLSEIVSEANMENILFELRQYAMDKDAGIANCAVKCIGKIGLNYSFASEISLEMLISLLKLELDHIISPIFEAIRDLLSKQRRFAPYVITNISSYLNIASDHPSGKSAVIWILGEFGEEIADSPYLLEDIAENLDQIHTAEVKLQLLNACMKLFFKRPPECQNLLGRVLEAFIDDEINMDVHDRAMFYYRCLKTDVYKARDLLSESREILSQQNLITDASFINNKEYLLDEFNTLSIIYDRPSSNFISHKLKS